MPIWSFVARSSENLRESSFHSRFCVSRAMCTAGLKKFPLQRRPGAEATAVVEFGGELVVSI